MENNHELNQNNQLDIYDDEREKLKMNEFDGIKELNNPPPPWLMALFYITIVFSAFYLVIYHVTKALPLQDQEYLNELAKAEKKKEKAGIADVKPAEMITFTDAASLAEGKELFTKFTCVTCHGQKGEGMVGPNLTDEYWIYGNKIENLYEIISNGNITKGMTPFKDQMNREQILKTASYVLSLKGTNPPNAKAPQGEKVE
ncbi:MAG: c-type cytochrome [Sphingobacteriales bacterium]|nr:c-type cytochrome [Sphingobacteriales bacterium]